MDPRKFHDEMAALIDELCEGRALAALRVLLPHYPIHNALTDEWAELAAALKNVRVQHHNGLPEAVLNRVISLQHAAESALERRS